MRIMTPMWVLARYSDQTKLQLTYAPVKAEVLLPYLAETSDAIFESPTLAFMDLSIPEILKDQSIVYTTLTQDI